MSEALMNLLEFFRDEGLKHDSSGAVVSLRMLKDVKSDFEQLEAENADLLERLLDATADKSDVEAENAVLKQSNTADHIIQGFPFGICVVGESK